MPRVHNKVDIHAGLCANMHELYERKNADYGDSFSQLRKRYPNFVCMRLFDKLNRLDTILKPGHELQVTDEKIEDTLMDIANYAIMELTERTAEKESHTEEEEPKEPLTEDEKSARTKVLKTLRQVASEYNQIGYIGCVGLACKDCPAYIKEINECVFSYAARKSNSI